MGGDRGPATRRGKGEGLEEIGSKRQDCKARKDGRASSSSVLKFTESKRSSDTGMKRGGLVLQHPLLPVTSIHAKILDVGQNLCWTGFMPKS